MTMEWLIGFLKKAKFRRCMVIERPEKVLVEVTITGWGRIRWPTKKEREEIMAVKPVFVRMTFTRYLWRFRLWTVNV